MGLIQSKMPCNSKSANRLFAPSKDVSSKDAPSDDSDQPEEWIDKEYENFDKNKHMVKAPWKAIAVPSISMRPPGVKGTMEYLASILDNLWGDPNGTVCAAPRGCHLQSGQSVMYQCEACRAYYHLKCVSDFRPPPPTDRPYYCLMHKIGKAFTNIINFVCFITY